MSAKLRHGETLCIWSVFLVAEEGRPVRVQAWHLGGEAGVGGGDGRGGGRGRPGPAEALLNPGSGAEARRTSGPERSKLRSIRTRTERPIIRKGVIY